MWILGNLLSSNPTILYTIDDNDLKGKNTTKYGKTNSRKKRLSLWERFMKICRGEY